VCLVYWIIGIEVSYRNKMCSVLQLIVGFLIDLGLKARNLLLNSVNGR
jgi:hypothetical protein